jgi:ABC-type glycerol-3-phosphate transport system permease component
MANTINWLGRGLGVACGAAIAAVWAFVLWVPSAGLTVTGISVVTALVLVVFGVFAAVAAAHGHALVVALFFLASFFPVGAFLLPTDHWLKWVGWIDLGLLVAAILIWSTRQRAVSA